MSSHHSPAEAAPVERRVAALEELLTERGLVPPGFVDEVNRAYEQDIGPRNGAKVVARAWVDPEYRRRLLADGTAAIAEPRRRCGHVTASEVYGAPPSRRCREGATLLGRRTG